jgi:serine/threonine protein kinase
MKTDQMGNIPQSIIKDLEKEISIVQKIQHKNLASVVGFGREVQDSNEILYILMENAQEGELFDMVANSGKFSERVARYFMKQLLNFLSHIHNQMGICHRDLKPENILLDEHFNIKVADFGFATYTC